MYRKVLILFVLVVGLSISGAQAGAVDPGADGLVVYYPLDGDVTDASGNGMDAIIDGDPVFVDDGMVGGALEFSGDDYVDCVTTEDLANWTISAWVRSPMAPVSDAGQSGPIHREANYQMNWNHGGGGWSGAVGLSAGGWHAASLGELEADTWYHLAGTYDGETLKAYKNGELITANEDPSGPAASESNSMKLGKHARDDYYFTGTIDEAMVYNRALSADEIKYLAGERATKIVWVSEWNADADGVPFDQGWIDLLSAAGYDVDANTAGDYMEVTEGKLATLEAADLIIVSRNTNSGNYAGDVNEVTLWNSIETPLILMSAYLTRNSKWQWIDSGTTNQGIPATSMDVVAVDHPVFAGITLDANNIVDVIDETVNSETTEIAATDVGNGTLLASRVDNGNIWIAEWEAGVTGYEGTDQVLAGKRMYFAAGGGQGQEAGVMSFNEDGQKMFLNAVKYMLPVMPVHSYTFEDGTANDSADDADGVLIGNAAVRAGALDLTDGGYMSMPGDVIAMNTYDAVTVELWFTSVPGGNTGFHMITAFGEEGTGAADWAGYKYLFISPARGDDVSRAAIQTVSMDDSPWDEETGVSAAIEHDDGLQHYFVCTVDATDITFYIDGELIGSTPLAEGNAISGIGTDVAYIGKGVYPVDPCWVGTVEELNIYDQALSMGQVQANYAAGPVKLGPTPVDPGTDGLLAYYPLDAIYRGTTPDASGNGNDGTVMGDPDFVPGMVAQAIDLDGDGDYVDCGANPLFGMQETNEMTAACWVTIRSIANQWAAIVAKGEHAWRLGNASLDPRFHFGITIWNAPDTASTDGVLAVGFDEWHHVAGVFDGANINLYVDGALDISVPTTEPIGVNELNVFIGDNPEATGRYWDGLVDELMIYNRALSENELLFLAQ